MPDVFPAATEEAIDYAIDAGVLVVFAAGNDADNGDWYPGAHEPVSDWGAGAACRLRFALGTTPPASLATGARRARFASPRP